MSAPLRSTTVRRVAFALAFIAAACKPSGESEVKTVLGLEAGLDGDIKRGAAAPTFVALSSWYSTFRVEYTGEKSRDTEDGGRIYDGSDLSRKIPAAAKKDLRNFISSEKSRLQEVQDALNKGKAGDARLRQLLAYEAAEMQDVIEALLFRYSYTNDFAAAKNRTRPLNYLARLIADRDRSEFMSRFAFQFYYQAFKGRTEMLEIATQLDRERANYVNAMYKVYLKDDAGRAKLAKAVKSAGDGLDSLSAAIDGDAGGLGLRSGDPHAATTGAAAALAALAPNIGLTRNRAAASGAIVPPYTPTAGATPGAPAAPAAGVGTEIGDKGGKTTFTTEEVPLAEGDACKGTKNTQCPPAQPPAITFNSTPLQGNGTNGGGTNGGGTNAGGNNGGGGGANGGNFGGGSGNGGGGGNMGSGNGGGGIIPPPGGQPIEPPGDNITPPEPSGVDPNIPVGGDTPTGTSLRGFGLNGATSTSGCPAYAPVELKCGDDTRCATDSFTTCADFDYAPGTDEVEFDSGEDGPLALADKEPTKLRSTPRIDSNKIECKPLESNPIAFVECMQRSPGLINRADLTISAANLSDGFSLADDGDAAAIIQGLAPNCVPDEIFTELTTENAVAVLDQGANGSCTGFSGALAVAGTGQLCDNSYSVAGQEVWGRYEQPYMDAAATALKVKPVPSQQNPSSQMTITRILTVRDVATAQKALFCLRRPLWTASSITEEWMGARSGAGTGLAGGAAGTLPQLGCQQIKPGAGHAWTIWGYDKVGFIMRNSWGADWGYRGFAIVPYNCIQTLGIEAYMFMMQGQNQAGAACKTEDSLYQATSGGTAPVTPIPTPSSTPAPVKLP